MLGPEPEVVLACERAEVAARASHHAAGATAGAALGVAHRALGGAVARAAPGAELLMFNRLLGLGAVTPARERDLDEGLAFLRDSGVRRCMVALAPRARPDALPDWLARRGLHPHNAWLKLHRDAAPSGLPPDPRVGPLAPGDVASLARLLTDAFGQPAAMLPWTVATLEQTDWSFFVAREGGAPVAGAGLHVDGDAAWLGMAAVRPGARGRGLQRALIACRIEAARAAGCRHLVVETALDTPEKPNPSARNLRRLGFRDAYERPNWILEPPPAG